jgi:hypothetical protein
MHALQGRSFANPTEDDMIRMDERYLASDIIEDGYTLLAILLASWIWLFSRTTESISL